MSESAHTKRIVSYYWRHAWKYKGLVIGLMITVPLAILTFQFLPALAVAAILRKINAGDFTRGHLLQSFGPELLAYIATSIVGGIIMWRIAVILIWKLEMRVQRDIYREVFAHLMSLGAAFHANRFGGSLVSQTNKLAGAYVRMADTTVFSTSGLILAFIFTTIILWPSVPFLALGLPTFSALFIAGAIVITRKVRVLNAAEATAENKQTGVLADAITNIMAVKSFAGGAQERERFAAATNDSMAATRRLMVASIRRDFVFATSTNVMSVASLTLALIALLFWNADIATVFLVVNYTANISQRLWDFCQSALRNYNRALGDSRDMIEVLATEPDVKDPAKPQKSRIKAGAIEFDHVSFNHDESKADDGLFNDLLLHIKSGEKIGLVGPSGSGKTTLTRLLLRFNNLDGGRILIDGQDIARLAQDDLRQHIAYVPQEPLLFHRSIAENIAYGRPDASHEAIVEAAKKAHADAFIHTLADGYETLVGERGVKLSGGQRQRIAIARAILKDAPILVLDEATSALDSESEVLIQSALWELMKDRTAIVIAHRLSTIQKMDRILVLENGTITEEGSHAQLIKRKGTYARLWAHQSGGFIEE